MVFRLRFTESPPSFALCSGCLPACSRAISKSLVSRSQTTNMVVRRWAGVKDQRKALQWRWINQILSADVLTLTLIWLKLNLSFFYLLIRLKKQPDSFPPRLQQIQEQISATTRSTKSCRCDWFPAALSRKFTSRPWGGHMWGCGLLLLIKLRRTLWNLLLLLEETQQHGPTVRARCAVHTVWLWIILQSEAEK